MSSESVILNVLGKVASRSIVGGDGGLGGSMSRGPVSRDANPHVFSEAEPSGDPSPCPDLTQVSLSTLRSLHSGTLARCAAKVVDESDDHEALISLFTSAI